MSRGGQHPKHRELSELLGGELVAALVCDGRDGCELTHVSKLDTSCEQAGYELRHVSRIMLSVDPRKSLMLRCSAEMTRSHHE